MSNAIGLGLDSAGLFDNSLTFHDQKLNKRVRSFCFSCSPFLVSSRQKIRAVNAKQGDCSDPFTN